MACTDSPKFRVDVIFNSLTELEQEKELLESRLNEQRRKYHALEEIVEAAHAKCIVASERNIRMKENIDVAKQKVLRAEEQGERLQQLNEEKRLKISKLNQSINDVNQEEIEETESLKNQLSELAEKFRGARSLYKDESLQSEIVQWKQKQDQYKQEAQVQVTTLNNLNDELNKLTIEGDHIKEKLSVKLQYDLTSNDLQKALSTFTDMKQVMEDNFEKCQTNNIE